MREKTYHYYVEGQDDKKIIDVLKSDLRYIVPGKVQVLNVVQEKIPIARIRTLKDDTIVILVFDTDAGNRKILDSNIELLKKSNKVRDVWCITQVENLESELVRSCSISKIEELLGSKSIKDYKSDLIKENNLKSKLEKAKFNIQKMWIKEPEGIYRGIENAGQKIKIKKIMDKGLKR